MMTLVLEGDPEVDNAELLKQWFMGEQVVLVKGLGRLKLTSVEWDLAIPRWTFTLRQEQLT